MISGTYRRRSASPQERFWQFVRINGACWEWQGHCAGSGNYGGFRFDGRNWRAHRLMYEWVWGDLDPALFVLHSCDNPRCVRPAHLRLGTAADNARDAAERGRYGKRLGKRIPKTHCKRGHEFTEYNTYHYSDGSRACRECANAPRRSAGATKRQRSGWIRTHCPRGHEMTPDNTAVWITGDRTQRYCRECHRARARAYHAKKRTATSTT